MRAVVDTGVWYAIFTPGDQHHVEGKGKADLLELVDLVVPWPTLYETLRTKFVKNRPALDQFERYLKSHRVEYLADADYKDAALRIALESSRGKRPLSMIDCLIRLLLDDVNLSIQFLATFNVKDFSDVCRRRGVEII